MEHDVKDLKLAGEGKRRTEWAAQDMPVLAQISRRFAREKPLKGKRIAACLHVTTETANLMRTLQAPASAAAVVSGSPVESAAHLAHSH